MKNNIEEKNIESFEKSQKTITVLTLGCGKVNVNLIASKCSNFNNI
ncbi:MAG: hypothetical protein JEZ08_24225 [Clostridiales bacterium]|nr:hypothetical protein [Clostridiales bacterium]